MIKERIEQARKDGIAQAFVVYANIGNDSDELIVCTADEADMAEAVIVDEYFVENSEFFRTLVITAEVA
jgi:hypothetical protein